MRAERIAAGVVAMAFAMAASAAERSPLVVQALALEHGEGVAKDPVRAAELYCEAARDGDADAMYGLGWMYANGRGVARDDATAAALLAQAARRGHEQAANLVPMLGATPGTLPSCMTPPPPPAAAPPGVMAGEREESADEDPFGALPPDKRRIAEVVRRAAPRYAIDPAFALAVVAVESNFDPRARSPKDAQGLMQLVPDTAARFNVRNPLDVRENVRGGLSYLRWLLAYYRGDVAMVAAAYNAGEGAVDRHGGVPPYPETRAYVKRILALFRRGWHPYDPGAASEVSAIAREPRRVGGTFAPAR